MVSFSVLHRILFCFLVILPRSRIFFSSLTGQMSRNILIICTTWILSFSFFYKGYLEKFEKSVPYPVVYKGVSIQQFQGFLLPNLICIFDSTSVKYKNLWNLNLWWWSYFPNSSQVLKGLVKQRVAFQLPHCLLWAEQCRGPSSYSGTWVI